MSITEQIERLAEHRDRTLAKRSTAEVIEWIAAAADLWRADGSKWLERAAEEGSVATGFSPEMIRLGLTEFFHGVTRSALTEWVRGELGRAVDEWAGSGKALVGKRRLVGPRVVTHIFSGNLPNAAFQSLLCGLLVKAANVCKCAAGDPLLPRLFAESLSKADVELGRCVLFLDWRGGDATVENEVFGVSDAVIVSGGGEAVASVRSRVAPTVRLLAYGHRVSFACLAREKLGRGQLTRLAAAAARDVSMWDQQGCLSPHCIYVEQGGRVPALEFAGALAAEMAEFELKHPRGKLSLEEASAFMRLRGAYEFRASQCTGGGAHAAKNEVKVFGDEQNRWAVVYEEEPMWATSCLNRLVFVKPIPRLEDLPRHLSIVRNRLSCVGLAAGKTRAESLGEMFAAMGVSRVCPLGRMQNPPLNWHRDGQPTLGRLVQWIDFEGVP